jgi:GR25 family glycosyltransferase involved in LPS biosynthesis
MYEYFDDIVCINLDISVERKKHAQHYFDKLGIPARFFTAKKHPVGGMYGCFDSHIQILKEAYEKGLNNILVFEDDFLPTASYSEEKLQSAIDFMKSNNDWDIMHLGYSFIKDDQNGLSTIFNATNCTSDIVKYNPFFTQALCYSRKAMKTILENYTESIGMIHYDVFIASYLHLNSYCILPMIFDQNFYFQHNNQADDAIEVVIRWLFPFLAFTKFNYMVTLLKYWVNKYNQELRKYLYIFIFSLWMYKIKTAILLTKKIYIKDSSHK